jgi:hypothetical protein
MKRIAAITPFMAAACLALGAAAAVAEDTAPGQPPAPESASLGVSDLATMNLSGKSFNLGLAYAQTTFKTRYPNTLGTAQLTDNGAPTPILELNSGEKILTGWPMRNGGAIIGWNISASAGYFNTQYQLVNSAFRGQNLGTRVSGEYIGVAPTLFLKMGPLYPGRDIYWKVGYGIGPGLLQSSGTALFNTNAGIPVIYNVGSSAPALALYNTASWQLQIDHWYFDITGKWLIASGSNRSSLESYGFGVAYHINL